MADDITQGGNTLATRDVGNKHFSRNILSFNKAGVMTDVTPAEPLPVVLDSTSLAALETIDLGATSLAALESISVSMTDAATAAKQDETIVAINNLAGSEYEAVPASTADAICGATGGVGDYIVGVLVTPTTKSPGAVSLKDGAAGTPIPLFAGGADSITTLHPFFIPLGIRCASAGWRLTTGANLTALPVGNFT